MEGSKTQKTELMMRFANLQGVFELQPTVAWEALHGGSPTPGGGQVLSSGKSKKKKEEKERPLMLATRLLEPAEVLQLLQRQAEALSAATQSDMDAMPM